MNDLRTIEAAFQDYVLTQDSRIVPSISGPDEAYRAARLGIYFNAYRLRLAEVLGTDYEILKAYVGDDIFEQIAKSYIAQYGSTFRNVRWYGQHMADYLASATQISHHRVLSELARFEWTLGLAFDAADDAAVQFEELAVLAPESWATLRFTPHSSVHVLDCTSNAVEIWSALKENGEGVAPAMLAEPQAWVIWRHDFASYFRSLDKDAAWAVRAMQSGATFPAICEGLCQWTTEEDAAPRGAALLRDWVDEGWIAALR